MNYYLIGIKGSGMASLASLLHDLGHDVMGSDVCDDFSFSSELIKKNILCFPFIKNEHIENDILYKRTKSLNTIYIIGNSYKDDNIEVSLVKKNHYQYYYYHEFIGTFLNDKMIAISGTHGKTTTSTFIKNLLSDEKIAYIIGDGSGGAQKEYQYFILEACEYQDHFLAYKPDILVITNIEYDHPDYFKSFDNVKESFDKLKKQSKYIITEQDLKILTLRKHQNGTIVAINNNGQIVIFDVPLFGEHLIKDFGFSYLVLRKLGFSDEYIKERVNTLVLPKRRMETLLIKNTYVIDDYGHHPTEITMLEKVLREKYFGYPLKVIFQPHTYSRTITFINDFITVLNKFDEVYIENVFTSSREMNDYTLQKKINDSFNKFNKFNTTTITKVVKDINNYKNVVWIFLGAGNINRYIDIIRKETSLN